MKTMLRKLFLGLAILIVLLTVLAAAAVLFLKTSPGLALALREVNRAFSGTLAANEFRFSLWRGGFEFRDVSIRDPEGRELAGARRLFLKVAWSALLKREITAEKLILEEPRARLEVERDGRLTLTRALTREKEKEKKEPEKAGGFFPFQIVVKDVELTDGRVVYTVERSGLRVEAYPISLEGSADLARLEGDLTLRAGRTLLTGTAFDTEFADIGLHTASSSGLTAAELNAKAAGGSVLVRGEADLGEVFPAGFLGPAKLEALACTFLAAPHDIALEKVLKPEASGGLRGRLEAKLTGSARGISPSTMSAKLDLSVAGERLANNRFPEGITLDLGSKASLENGVARFEQLDLRSADVEVQGDGRYSLADGALDAKLHVEAPNLTRPLSLLGMEGGGSLLAEARVSGKVSAPVASVSVQGKGLRFRDIRIGNLALRADLDEKGRLTLPSLDLKNRGSIIQGSGLIQLRDENLTTSVFRPERLAISFRNVILRNFLDRETVAGNLNGSLLLLGEPAGLRGSLDLHGKDLQLSFVRLGDLAAKLKLSRGTVHLERAVLKNRSSTLDIGGWAKVLENDGFKPLEEPAFDVSVTGESILLKDFRDGWQGQASVTAQVKGSPARPEGFVRLQGRELDLGYQKLAGIELHSVLAGERLRLETLRISVTSGESIEGSGWVALDRSYDLRLISSGVSLSNINLLRERVDNAEGRASFELAGSGTLATPRLEGTIRIDRPSLGDTVFPDIQLGVLLENDTARVTGNLGFELNAAYGLTSHELTASIIFDETDLAPAFVLLKKGDLTGKITGRVEARGNARDIRQAVATLDLSSLVVSGYGQELASTRELKLSYRNGRITTPGFKIALAGQGEMNVKGEASSEGQINSSFSGSIPLSSVNFLIPSLEDLQGGVRFQFSAAGPFRQPRFDGDVSVDKVAFIVPRLLQNVHDLQGRLRLSGAQVTLDRMEGGLDRGRFGLEGKIDLAGFKPANGVLSLKAEALPIQIPDTMDLVLNADLRWRKSPRRSSIRGEVVLLEGLYYRDVNLSLIQQIGKRKRETTLEPKSVHVPLLGDTRLKVAVTARQPLAVENNLATMEIRPDLQTAGTLSKPVLTGRAEVVSGTVTYQRKEFVIRRGVIDFINPYKIEPALDIRSDVQFRDWTIFLGIEGTPDELRFTLTSDPPEQQADLVSLLLMGKTTRELAGGSVMPSQPPAQMLAKLVASTFGEGVKETAGLDVLQVESITQRDQKSPLEDSRTEKPTQTTPTPTAASHAPVGPSASPTSPEELRVTVGKKLSRRVTIKYQIETGPTQTVQRAISEYQLLENFLVSGFQDTQGSFGGGIVYRLEFR